MQHVFSIHPYSGVGPITFGMSRRRVAALLGQPEAVDRDFLGRVAEVRGGVSVKYDKANRVNEISFTSDVDVYLGDVHVFASKRLLKQLAATEEPYETVGFKVFFGIGIALTGFGKKKEAKTLSVFSKDLVPLWRA